MLLPDVKAHHRADSQDSGVLPATNMPMSAAAAGCYALCLGWEQHAARFLSTTNVLAKCVLNHNRFSQRSMLRKTGTPTPLHLA